MENRKSLATISLLMLLLSMCSVMVKPASGSSDGDSSWNVLWHDPGVFLQSLDPVNK
jgi:hypothetical protein